MPGFCSLDQNETAFWHSVAVLCCDVRPKIKAPYVVLPWYLIKLGGFCVVVVVQLLSCVWLFAIPQTVASQALLSVSTSWSLLRLMSIESVMPSNHLILCFPLLLLPSIFPSIGSFLRILEQVALSSPRGSSWARDRMCLLHCRWILYHWVTCEAPFRE